MLEAYILVRRCKFSYSDVNTLTRYERIKFLDLYREEVKAEEDAYKRNSGRR